MAGAVEKLNAWLGQLLGWFTLAMVLLTFAVVVLRYGFSIGFIAMQELVIYLHAAVFMLGAAFALRHGEHVRVDIFYQRLGVRGQAWVNLLGTLLLLLPFCLFVIWASVDYALESWRLLEGSQEAGGLPAVFLLKSLIPAMALLLAVQGLVEVAQAWRQLQSQSRGRH